MVATVSLVRAENRRNTVTKALEAIGGDVGESLRAKKRIVIKPNLVSPSNPVCATHVDTVRATIDFLQKHTSAKMLIAEGSAFNTRSCFKNYGYSAIAEEYDIELVDLNEDESVQAKVFDRNLREVTITLARTMVEADYRVSLAIPKTHDCLIATLSLKNMVVGSAQSDKNTLHADNVYSAMNLNMYEVVRRIPPSLAVIDGWVGMEGNGPVDGTPVPMGVALASTDFVAADTVGAYIMGFDPTEIGYLTYANGRLGEGDLSRIKVTGEEPSEVRRKFRPHQRYLAQKEWQIPPDTLNRLLR